jgi:hypothetical protein
LRRTPVADRPQPLWKSWGQPPDRVCTGWAYPCGYLRADIHNLALTSGFIFPRLWRRKRFDTPGPVVCAQARPGTMSPMPITTRSCDGRADRPNRYLGTTPA